MMSHEPPNPSLASLLRGSDGPSDEDIRRLKHKISDTVAIAGQLQSSSGSSTLRRIPQGAWVRGLLFVSTLLSVGMAVFRELPMGNGIAS